MSIEAITTEAPAAAAAPAEGGSLLAEGAPAAESAAAAPAEGAESEKPAEGTQGSGEAEAAAGEPEKPAGEAEGEQAAGAPEEYAEFTLPEGVTLDPEADAGFKAKAKELNLSQEGAQKLVDEFVAIRQREATAAKAFIEERGGVIVDPAHAKRWRETVQADPEIGGDKLPENLATARRAIDAYGTPALFQILDKSGLADNPEVLRFLIKAGRTAGEDKVVQGGRPSSAHGTLAQRLYATPSAKE